MHHVYKITAVDFSNKSAHITFRDLDTSEVAKISLPFVAERIAMAKLKRIYEAARVLFGEDLGQLVGQTVVAENLEWPMVGPGADKIRSFSFVEWAHGRNAHDNDRGDMLRKARRFGPTTYVALAAMASTPRAKKAARRLWREFMLAREA